MAFLSNWSSQNGQIRRLALPDRHPGYILAGLVDGEQLILK
jgi:hypothetical protein